MPTPKTHRIESVQDILKRERAAHKAIGTQQNKRYRKPLSLMQQALIAMFTFAAIGGIIIGCLLSWMVKVNHKLNMTLDSLCEIEHTIAYKAEMDRQYEPLAKEGYSTLKADAMFGEADYIDMKGPQD